MRIIRSHYCTIDLYVMKQKKHISTQHPYVKNRKCLVEGGGIWYLGY